MLHDLDTVLPIREIAALLHGGAPTWTFQEVGGGHMAPLTRPSIINPIMLSFLQAPAG